MEALSVDRGLSPSLAGSAGRVGRVGSSSGEAYEVKFALDEATAREVESRLASVLALDPHSDPALGGAYAVTSLYTDTPGYDVYFREGRFAAKKYRVRRYGDNDRVYVERKTVRERRVRKRRTEVGIGELPRVMAQQSGESEWFARQVEGRELGPVCRVRYLRRAMYGMCPAGGGPMRVTFDRSVRGVLVDGWTFDAASEERVLLDGVVVCEFKFAGAMPAAMKKIVADLKLSPSGMSKYRACVRAFRGQLGLPAEKGAGA